MNRSRYLLGLLLVVFYVVANPYWYGDGVWYALDIKSNAPLPVDAGHLLWTPFAKTLHSLFSLFFLSLDPLLVLQVLSAIGAVLLLHATSLVSLHLGFSLQARFLTIATLACSHFVLVYGGSGSSYTWAAALVTYSSAMLIRPEQNMRHSIVSLVFALFAWAFWGVSILSFPALCILYAITRRQSFRQRLKATLFSAVTLGASWATLVLLTYIIFVPEHSYSSAVDWFRASSHGIATTFSPVSVARAALGYTLSLTYLGELGKSLKFLILSNTSSLSLTALLPYVVAFLISVTLIGLAWFRTLRFRYTGIQKLYSIFALALAIPILAFAVLWQGSDVERFSQLLPSTLILLFLPYASLTTTKAVPVLIPLILAAFHLSTRILPPLISLVGTPAELAMISKAHLAPQSLVVVHGQRYPASLWAPAQYMSGHTFYNLQYDSQTNGKREWKERLRSEIKKTLKRGGDLAVHAQLLRPAEGDPLELSVEQDVPTLQETAYAFRNWQFQKAWYVGEDMFVVLSPKKD